MIVIGSLLYIQLVFAVKGRQSLLSSRWRVEIFKYISGIISYKGQKPIIVNGVEDHIHVLVGLKPSMAISDLARDIKNNSSKFNTVNNIKFNGRFNLKANKWQDGKLSKLIVDKQPQFDLLLTGPRIKTGKN